jgi:hypothetical protein
MYSAMQEQNFYFFQINIILTQKPLLLASILGIATSASLEVPLTSSSGSAFWAPHIQPLEFVTFWGVTQLSPLAAFTVRPMVPSPSKLIPPEHTPHSGLSPRQHQVSFLSSFSF